MSKRHSLGGFALLGFAIAAGELAWLEFTFDPHVLRSDWQTVLLLVLCPPSFLSVAFIDIQPTTTQILELWSVVGVLNSMLYGAIGWFIGNLRRKPK